ncbi:MAG: hypothetical protein GKR89_33360 [Candidatus Latescibacteria bacterium]|nr:hypothetical protein [Candidatus Latescibacterota bacterium]
MYKDVDWSKLVERYTTAYGQTIDPVALFDDALHGGTAGLERFKKAYVFGPEDSGAFERWEAKNSFLTRIWACWCGIDQLGFEQKLLKTMLDRSRSEGMTYIEYRCGSGIDGFMDWHPFCAQTLMEHSDDEMTARYILSMSREEPLKTYELLLQILDEQPELVPCIVGVDFCGAEEGFPPKDMRPFFLSWQAENRLHPNRALDVVYHVGESYFDKSLESAVRWCHEVAEMGALRLGHAIALGLDPVIAVARRPHAHEEELVAERLDQIEYDLRHSAILARYGIEVDQKALENERAELEIKDSQAKVHRVYDDKRLQEIRRRQDMVLDQLIELGTVIECCPNSNLRIGGVPAPEHHPLHRFLRSQVNLVICSDDPGNMDAPLASEVEWVVKHTNMNARMLEERLGDPRRFRLGLGRK